MAKIGSFARVESEVSRLHEEIECGWRVFAVGDERVVQLDTYGTRHRAQPGKVSQSIQVDEVGAEELVRILFEAFPGLRRRL